MTEPDPITRAREVLADFDAPGWAKYDPAGMQAFVLALRALLAHAEPERAQLKEYRGMVAFAASAFECGENGAPVLRAFLAKAEDS